MDSIYLMGSEDVRQAAQEMKQAAGDYEASSSRK